MKFRFVSVKVRHTGGLGSDHNVYDVRNSTLDELIDHLEVNGFEIINIIPLYNFTKESYLDFQRHRK